MAPGSDSFDLAGLRLTTGEGRRLGHEVEIEPFELAGERYRAEPPLVTVVLNVSKTTGDGYSLRLQFSTALSGPCMRCLSDAQPEFAVEAREVSQPGGGDQLESPYVEAGALDLRAWASDALALVLPAQILCRPDCLGLCPVCGVDLTEAGPAHEHEREMDSRWSKLSELKFDA